MHSLAPRRLACPPCGTTAAPAEVTVAQFSGTQGVDEYHLVITPHEYADFATQLEWIDRAYAATLLALGLDPATAVLRRFFCSDLTNQADLLAAHPLTLRNSADAPCAVSWVGQSPLPPAKVALWAYHVHDAAAPLQKTQHGATLALRRGPLTHCWTTHQTAPGDTAYDQTRHLLQAYTADLQAHDLTLADHVLRTWLFVRDIDLNYAGLVIGRREIFTDHGLTPETHYIASSGIAGTSADLQARVAMDAYAVGGLQPGQVQYLSALDHLGPTHLYGVTFERATSVAYRDRKHVILSGTASIDPAGNILHPGDVTRQLDRTLENIAALLAPAGATLEDMSMFIVYLRDAADEPLAQRIMRERFPGVPLVVVHAPVCRPGWLIELEGLAILPHTAPTLPAF